MHRREDDDSGSLQPLSICRRLYRFVVAKLGILGEKEMNEDEAERNKKLTKKGSKSDITIHFKQIEESEENGKRKNNSHGQGSGRETVITLANGSNGPKKRLQDKGKKSMVSEPSPQAEAGRAAQAHRGPRPFLSDINKKSDAFIESTLEKMRKSLASCIPDKKT